MKRISSFVVKYPKNIIAVTIAITLFLGFFISHVYFDNEVSHIVPKKHPTNVFDKESVSIFGSSDYVLIELISKDPNGVFNYATLRRIDAMSRILEQYEYVDKVESLALSKNITGTKDSMSVGPLWEEGTLADDPALIAQIKTDAMSNKLFRRSIVSDDATTAGIVIKMKKSEIETIDIAAIKKEFDAYMPSVIEAMKNAPLFEKMTWKNGNKTAVFIFNTQNSDDLSQFIADNGFVSNKFYDGTFTDDKKVTMRFSFNEKYFSGALADKVIHDVEKVIREIRGDEEVFYSGESVVNGQLGTYIVGDLKLLVPVVIFVVAIFLYFAFRTGRGIVFPLMSVLISSVCTMGLMGLMNIPINQVSVIIPVLLIGVGSSYGIHILNNYYEKIMFTEDKAKLIDEIITVVGRGVIMAGLTTVAGFGSFVTSDIPHMKYFGLFTALGIFTALCLNIVFVTAVLLLLPKPKHIRDEYLHHHKEEDHSGFNLFLKRLAESVSKTRTLTMVVSVIVIAISLWGMKKLIVDTNTVEFFGKKSMVRRADTAINEKFGGTNVMRIVIDGLSPDIMKEPTTLKKIENIQRFAEQQQYVGKTMSFVDSVKLMNKAMNENKEEFYTIPDNKDLISQYLFLYSSSGDPNDFNDVVDFDYRKANIVVQMTIGSTSKISTIVKTIEEFARKEFNDTADFDTTEAVRLLKQAHLHAYVEAVESYDPAIVNETLNGLKADKDIMKRNDLAQIVNDYSAKINEEIKNKSTSLSFNSIEIVNAIDGILYGELNNAAGTNAIVRPAGVAVLYVAVSKLIIDTQISSIISSIIIVLLINTLIFRSIGAGLTSIFPLSFTILVNFGIMGYTGTSLNMATSIIAAIAIGIGVDYAIHFLNRFLFEYNAQPDGDWVKTMTRTMMTSGRAIIYNMLSVMFGFLVLCLSNFPLLRNTGWLLALTMIVSGIGALTILPVFLVVFKPKFVKTVKSVE